LIYITLLITLSSATSLAGTYNLVGENDCDCDYYNSSSSGYTYTMNVGYSAPNITIATTYGVNVDSDCKAQNLTCAPVANLTYLSVNGSNATGEYSNYSCYDTTTNKNVSNRMILHLQNGISYFNPDDDYYTTYTCNTLWVNASAALNASLISKRYYMNNETYVGGCWPTTWVDILYNQSTSTFLM